MVGLDLGGLLEHLARRILVAALGLQPGVAVQDVGILGGDAVRGQQRPAQHKRTQAVQNDIVTAICDLWKGSSAKLQTRALQPPPEASHTDGSTRR